MKNPPPGALPRWGISAKKVIKARANDLLLVENSVEIVDNRAYNAQRRRQTDNGFLCGMVAANQCLFKVFVNIPMAFHKEPLLF